MSSTYALYTPSFSIIPPLIQSQIDLQDRERCGPSFCAGTNTTNDSSYVCGDSRLGPAVLPACPPLTSFFSGTNYSRFGGLCPGEFIAKWTQSAPVDGVAFFEYPFANGFANDTTGTPIRGRMTLVPGTKVDRFGSAFGTFVAPAGSPYDQRALPPSNLGRPAHGNSTVTFNYHVYEVQKPVVVIGGPVTPWFGQPGSGTQFELSTSVMQLVQDGVLEEIIFDKGCTVKRK